MFKKGDKVRVKNNPHELIVDREVLTCGSYGVGTGNYVCYFINDTGERIEFHPHSSCMELVK